MNKYSSSQPTQKTRIPDSDGEKGLRVDVVQLTDPGKKRKINEDAVLCHVPEDPEQLRSTGVFCVVADGMGGHDAGEVASRTAVESACGAYLKDTDPDVKNCLKNAVEAANATIGRVAQSIESQAGIGTTLVAAAIRGDKAWVANVGDSRAYLVRGGRASQITTDHSWVQEQIDAGKLTREEVQTHPRRNLITRAMGLYPRVEIDLFTQDLEPGDYLVLCSDGLWGLVDDQEIAQRISDNPLQTAARNLIDLANERGGPDNITLAIIHILETEEIDIPKPDWEESTQKMVQSEDTERLNTATPEEFPWGLVVGAGILLALLVLASLYYFVF